MGAQQSANTAITSTQLEAWAEAFSADPQARIAQNALTQNALADVAQDNAKATALSGASFSLKIDAWDVTNQEKSGRCWMFAGYNAAGRPEVFKETGLKKFEFSFAYLQFFDLLEKANVFLRNICDLADAPFPGEFLVSDVGAKFAGKSANEIEPGADNASGNCATDSWIERAARVVATILENPVYDGGWWESFAALVQKYGAVPKYAMPETESSPNTTEMDSVICRRLRRAAWEIHHAQPEARGDIREAALADVYRILRIHLGTPPQQFMWQWEDKDGEFHREGVLTPQEFAQKAVPDIGEYVTLLVDPRLEVGQAYAVDRRESMAGYPQVFHVVSMDTLREATLATLRAGEPVWMACDVSKEMDRKKGIGTPGLFDEAGIYGVDTSLENLAGLSTLGYMPTHAMAFTGVDLDESGQPLRWRIENSWGEDNGDKGFVTVSDEWVEAHTYVVVVKNDAVPEQWRAGIDDPDARLLPAWDILA